MRSAKDRIVFDGRGERSTPLGLWKEQARAGGVFPVSEGSTGFFIRDGDDAETMVALPPNAPHLSLWRLPNRRLVRLRYRDFGGRWDYDETRHELVVRQPQLAITRRTADDVYLQTPWPRVQLRLPADFSAETRLSIFDAIGIDLSGVLRLA